MRIFMETDAVRGMAARAKQTADNLDGRIDALLSQIENMEWQSNARTEFDGNFKSIHRNIKSIANAMRSMGSAADAKAAQWEAIANKFLGPFVAIGNFWRSAIDQLGTIGAVIGGILIGGITRWIQPWQPKPGSGDNRYFPTPFPFPGGQPLPRLWPGRGGVDRGIQGPSWQPDRPDWLPGSGGSSGGGGGGSGGGGWGPDGSAGGEGGNSGGGGGGGGAGGSAESGSSASAPTEGIPSSRTPNDKLGILGGCTNYVATKRDVSGFWRADTRNTSMNAQYWNDHAIAAGFEVGNKPVAGSIMVIEADNGIDNGIMNVNDQAGHVLYVESVKETNGGYLVNYSHAGTLYDDAGNYIPGTYKMLNNSAPVFVPYQSNAVSFIYDKV